MKMWICEMNYIIENKKLIIDKTLSCEDEMQSFGIGIA